MDGDATTPVLPRRQRWYERQKDVLLALAGDAVSGGSDGSTSGGGDTASGGGDGTASGGSLVGLPSFFP
jgi:hypothetical protein